MTTAEILARLVGFNTVSNLSNLPLVDWIETYLLAHGIKAVRVPDPTGEKACLFARIGPDEGQAIGLSAHTDVVPVEGQNWTSDPFVLTERDGRLYGRGSCDMKGFIACVLAAVPAMVAGRLTTPIQIALTYDEETTFDGAVAAVGALGTAWQKPRAMIVGEPTSMKVVDAHLSIAGSRMKITGRAAHSSQPQRGANAIFAAGLVIEELARIRDELIAAGDPTGRFTPPYSSVNIGRIEGGTAHNIVAETCRVEYGMRGVPGSDVERLLDRVERFADRDVLPILRASAPEAEITHKRWLFVPGLEPQPGSEAETLAFQLAGTNGTTTVAYATEGGVFQRAGIPTVVCGPGSIDQAHAPDEYIELSELAACERFIARLIERCR